MNRMTRKAVIGELRELKHMFQRRYDKYPTCLEEAIDYIYQTPRWIPVSERLPEDGTWNIFSDGKNISVERYKMDAIDHFFPQGRWFSLDEAIAWMPLPEPYREEVSD